MSPTENLAMVRMTDLQLRFWRALLAPFPDWQLSVVTKAGRELTYIDSRALMNRLDSVCGPHGWDVEYTPTERGYTCKVGIMVPTESGAWIWLYKEDGGGFEDMGQRDKKTGEWETDQDNDEKSAYTNAFRRAAQNAWGIGRYLYRKGIPDFLDPDAPGPQPVLGEVPQPQPIPAPRPAPAPPQTAPAPAPSSAFTLPRAGKQVFAWASNMERHFQTGVVNGMKGEAEGRGLDPTKFFAWDQESVDAICGNVVAYLKTLPNYRGEFGPATDHPPPAPDKNALIDLKKRLWATIEKLVEVQIGRKPTTAELAESFGTISSECVNGRGSMGEVAASLKELADEVWLRNMAAFADQQLQQAMQQAMQQARAGAAAGDDAIPF